LAASPLTVAIFAGVSGTSTHFSSPAATTLAVGAEDCPADCVAVETVASVTSAEHTAAFESMVFSSI
jgi:hypothetical protein